MTDAPPTSAPPTQPPPRRAPTRRPAGRALSFSLWAMCAGATAWLGVDSGGAVVAPALIDLRMATLTAPMTTRVLQAKRAVGDDVTAGDVVIELDGAELDHEIALAEAELSRTKEAVRARQVGLKDQDFEVGLRLQADIDKAALTASTVAAELKQDETELASVAALVEKNEGLVKAQLASAQTLDELRVRRAALTQRVAAASDEARSAQRLREAAELRLKEWRARTGHDDALTAPDVAAVVLQEERVRQARWRKGLLSLRAPVAGRVGQLLAGPDDVVREGAPVALVIDNAPQRATAWIAENAAWRVRAGDAVTLTSTDGQGVKVTGRVRALGGGIVEIPARLQQIPGEPAFGRAAHVDLDAVPEGVLPGQSFEATFHRP